MIKKKTTFILGAGASMGYGFPSGKTLKALIWKRLELRPPVGFYKWRLPKYFYLAANCNTSVERSRKEFEQNVKEFRSNLMLSPDETIDYFLEHVSGNEYRQIGRLAIADVLLEREQDRYLFDDWMEYNSIEENSSLHEFLSETRIRPDDRHWYQFLFNQMSKKCDIGSFSENNVSFITFNYDRSLEYYFLHSLMAKYKVKKTQAVDVLSKFEIVHVYGQLERLSDLLPEDDSNAKRLSVPYNAFNSYNDQSTSSPDDKPSREDYERAQYLKNAGESIQLIWDNPNDDQNENIQKAVRLIYLTGNRIVFLGFGFDPMNLDRIMPTFEIPVNENINTYGTTLGLSNQRLKYLENKYKRQFPGGVSKGLFINYDMGLETGNLRDCTIYDYLFHSTELFE